MKNNLNNLFKAKRRHAQNRLATLVVSEARLSGRMNSNVTTELMQTIKRRSLGISPNLPESVRRNRRARLG